MHPESWKHRRHKLRGTFTGWRLRNLFSDNSEVYSQKLSQFDHAALWKLNIRQGILSFSFQKGNVEIIHFPPSSIALNNIQVTLLMASVQKWQRCCLSKPSSRRRLAAEHEGGSHQQRIQAHAVLSWSPPPPPLQQPRLHHHQVLGVLSIFYFISC